MAATRHVLPLIKIFFPTGGRVNRIPGDKRIKRRITFNIVSNRGGNFIIIYAPGASYSNIYNPKTKSPLVF